MAITITVNNAWNGFVVWRENRSERSFVGGSGFSQIASISPMRYFSSDANLSAP
jgi:hypothetical protein